MKVFLMRLAALCICIFLLSCLSDPSIEISGRIDESVNQKLQSLNSNHARIVVSSGGGLPDSALSMARQIEDAENDLVILGVCNSACAEYLLPAANSLIFQDNPIIGFHWNAMMIESLYKRHGRKDLEYCTHQDSKELYNLHVRSQVTPKFWQETFSRLGHSHFSLDYKVDECPWKKMAFENHLWLPTSEQLRNLWGLKFSGSVCADNFNVCKEKIDVRWAKGTRIVVGDEVYISKGRL